MKQLLLSFLDKFIGVLSIVITLIVMIFILFSLVFIGISLGTLLYIFIEVSKTLI